MAFTIRTAVISVTKANDLLQFLEYTAHVFDDFDDTGAAYSGTFGGLVDIGGESYYICRNLAMKG